MTIISGKVMSQDQVRGMGTKAEEARKKRSILDNIVIQKILH